MEDLLRSEGVEFDKDGCVLMDKYLWKPEKTRINKTSLNCKKKSSPK